MMMYVNALDQIVPFHQSVVVSLVARVRHPLKNTDRCVLLVSRRPDDVLSFAGKPSLPSAYLIPGTDILVCASDILFDILGVNINPNRFEAFDVDSDPNIVNGMPSITIAVKVDLDSSEIMLAKEDLNLQWVPELEVPFGDLAFNDSQIITKSMEY